MAQIQTLSASHRWLRAGVLAFFFCSLGVLVALSLKSSGSDVPLGWAVAVCALPSLFAGVLWARQMGVREAAATEDPLTGLHGEAKLREALEIECARARRLGKQVGVVIAEIKQDGRISIPHYVAWRVMARTIKSTIRVYDTCFVLKPGQFALLLSATNAEGGAAVVERLRRGFEKVQELKGVPIYFGQAVIDPAKPEEPALKVLEDALAFVKDPGTAVAA